MQKSVIFIVFFLIFSFSQIISYANSKSIAVIVRGFTSSVNEADEKIIHLYFSNILDDLGYNIVDRDELRSLLRENELEKRENYLATDVGEVIEHLINKNVRIQLPRKMNQDELNLYVDSMQNHGYFTGIGEGTSRVLVLDESGEYCYQGYIRSGNDFDILSKIQGVEEILFVDIFRENNRSLKIYYSISDVFQRTVLLFEKMVVDHSNLKEGLRKNRSVYTDKINNIRPLSVYFYSFNDKKSFRFISKSSTKIEEGSIIYGVSKVKDHTPIQFKVSEMLTSNMISANIKSYKKKEVGSLKNIDFSEFDYYLSSIPENQKSQELALVFEWRECCTAESFLDLIYSINKDYLMLDCFHKSLEIEKFNQTNELYLTGDSKYEDEKIQDMRYTFFCDKNNSFKVLKNGVKISTKTLSNSTFNDFVLGFLSLE